MGMVLETEALFFGPFRLLPVEQSIYEGERRLDLGSRAFEVLMVLIEQAGNLVSAKELIARVWPNLHVESAALRVHISALRKALGDDSGAPKYIVNVTGRGYRFAAALASRTQETALPEAAAPQNTPTLGVLALAVRIIGRESAILSLAQSLPRRRLLTIAGPGGIGKTTVALAVTERLAGNYRNGTLFIDLAPLADPLLLTGAVASALQLNEGSHDPIVDPVMWLQTKQMMLVLDNCEHLLEVTSKLVERILANAPAVHILITSREPLRASGEWVHRLQPLDLPEESSKFTAEEALASPAVLLFAERARAADDSFALLDKDALSAVEICRRLDGIPLAIELAAARVAVFGVQELASRLDDRFTLLTAGRRTALPRHRTLRAALDWSYQLLTKDETTLLRRLAVFRGRFAFDAVVAVACSGGDRTGGLIDDIASLVEKSLLVAAVADGVIHYRFLESTRAYALEKLAKSGEKASLSKRHAGYFRSLIETAEHNWETMSGRDWIARYGSVIDDVRAALDWSFLPDGDAALGVALTIASARLWFELALATEYRGRIERALAIIEDRALNEPEVEMRLNVILSMKIFFDGELATQNATASSKALEIATSLDDLTVQLRALRGLAGAHWVRGDYAAALLSCEQLSLVVEATHDETLTLLRDRMMAMALHLVGRQSDARPYAERAFKARPTLGMTSLKTPNEYDNRVASRAHLARILWMQGLPDQAIAAVRDGMNYALSLSYPSSLCVMLTSAACPIALWTGDMPTARRYAELLLEQAADLSFASFQLWERCFAGLVELGANDGSPGFNLKVLSLQGTASGAVYTDMLATIRVELAGAATVARGVSGRAGWCAAEILRAQSVALLRQGDPESRVLAEAALLRSLSLAREQGARSWELRTATTLARLYRDTQRVPQARDLVAEVYGAFTEGFGTADVQSAAALLSEL